MKRENRERFSAQHMLQQYDELLACEKSGYYNSCEMITVFILERNTKYIYNFYTIFVMEERLTVKAEERVKNLFSKKELRIITEVIFECIPIDLFTLSDRIGNFVFQFPSINTGVKDGITCLCVIS